MLRVSVIASAAMIGTGVEVSVLVGDGSSVGVKLGRVAEGTGMAVSVAVGLGTAVIDLTVGLRIGYRTTREG